MFFYDLITDWKWPFDGPYCYGLYHWMWIIIMIVVSVFLCARFGTKHDKKIDDKVIFCFGVLLVGIEIYKQVFNTLLEGYYEWALFPFQFCSVPMFIAFIAPLIKNEKIKDALYKFLGTFGLLAGISVMAYPLTVFNTEMVTILLHTMIWHSSMVIMGVYLTVSRGYGKNFLKDISEPSVVYIVIVYIAVVVNIIGYLVYFGTPNNIHGDELCLLYISPYYQTPIPVLADIKECVSYPLFLLIYILAFILGVSLLWTIIYGIRKLIPFIKNKITCAKYIMEKK